MRASSNSDASGVRPLRPLLVPFATGVPLLGLGPVAFAAAVKPFGATQMFLALSAIVVGAVLTPGIALWAEHRARHRPIQIAGLCVAAVGYAALGVVRSPLAQVAAGLCVGAGSGASLTMTLCNVVRATPSAVLERRLGVVTAAAQAGAFVGFVVALAVRGRTSTGGVVLTAVGCLLSAVVVRLVVVVHDPRPIGDGVTPVALLARTVRLMRPPFGVFWVGWALTFAGAMTVAGSFADTLTKGFGVDGAVVTAALAVGFALRSLSSLPAGELAQRVGAAPAMHALQAVRLVACAAMIGAVVAGPTDGSTVAQVVVVVAAVVIVASVGFVAVPSAAVSVRLTGSDMSAALGAFFVAEFLGTATGFVVAESVAARAGYDAVPVVATVAIVVGAAVLFGARRQLAGRTRTDTVPTAGSTVSS